MIIIIIAILLLLLLLLLLLCAAGEGGAPLRDQSSTQSNIGGNKQNATNQNKALSEIGKQEDNHSMNKQNNKHTIKQTL